MTVTQSDNVPEADPPLRAPSRRHRWWAVPLACLGCVTIVAPVVAAFVPAKWLVDKTRCTESDGTVCTASVTEAAEFALVPADAEPVRPRLDITGIPTYDDGGDIYFVTIREPMITMLDWFGTRDNDAIRLRSHYDKYGDRTEEQRLQEGQLQMSGAKEWAVYNALTLAGYEPEFVPGEAMVQYVLCLEANAAETECLDEAPAGDFLEPFDVIVELDGEPVTIIDDLLPILADHQPGDVVPVTVRRGEEEVSGTVELIQAPSEDEPRTIIGFMPVDTTQLQLPDGLSVLFNTEGIGGPSAGLAFTVTLLDAVTEGSLTGGTDVAITGAIDVDGNVIAIGGLNSKASAVQQMGVKYFLVPASQPDTGPDSVAAAREVVGDDVQIIPVATLMEALEALESLGGDPLPAGSAPPTTTA